MCLGLPAKVIEVKGGIALVDFGGVKKEVDAFLTPDIKPGDYVIVHAGAIISKIDQETALEMIKVWKEVLEALAEQQ